MWLFRQTNLKPKPNFIEIGQAKSFVKGVVGWVDLCTDDSDQLENFSQKSPIQRSQTYVQTEKEGFMLQDSFLRGIRQLKNFNLTYDILIYPHQLEEAILLVEKNPHQPFVLDHLAKPYIKDQKIKEWASHIKKLAKHKNVYCKLSGMITEADWNHWQAKDFDNYLSVVLEAFGPGRLMFGSDWPVCLLAGSYQHVVQIVELFLKELKPIDQNKIMRENARNFYKL